MFDGLLFNDIEHQGQFKYKVEWCALPKLHFHLETTKQEASKNLYVSTSAASEK